MRTIKDRNVKLSGLVLLAGILLTLSPLTRAQTITAEPETVVVDKATKKGSTTITWDAGTGVTSVGATVWQQINGGKETLVSPDAKGSQSILVGAGQTRVFKLRTLIKSKVLASVTVTAVETKVSFAGMWVARPQSDSGDLPMTFKLQQAGSKVTGFAFFGNNDKQKADFDGEVSGSTLKFRLSSSFRRNEDSPTGEFVMAQDGRSFTGKVSGGTPVIATVLPNFAGVWQAKWGDGTLQLIIQQTGPQAGGQLAANSGTFIITDGNISGNTLRFKVMRQRLPTEPLSASPFMYLGTGELVMDESGKLFTGHVLGKSTSDVTLVAR
ncbi:MAG: hypothetical protein JO053_07360 [Acidobacteria bacterium]|nr:hypothetical protein [Acidobacteriota bacterium]